VYTALLYRTTRKLAIDADKTGTQQLNLAGDTARRQLRAYIVAKPIAMGTDGVGKPMVQLLIHNIGQTATFDIKSHGILDIRNFFRASDVFAIPDLPLNPPIFSLQPKEMLDGPLRPDSSRVFTRKELSDAVLGQTHRLYIYGYVLYSDVFGDSHETPFVMTVSGGPGLQKLFNGQGYTKDNAPRFEANMFDRKLT
jgi:hypothetical protein